MSRISPSRLTPMYMLASFLAARDKTGEQAVFVSPTEFPRPSRC